MLFVSLEAFQKIENISNTDYIRVSVRRPGNNLQFYNVKTPEKKRVES